MRARVAAIWLGLVSIAGTASAQPTQAPVAEALFAERCAPCHDHPAETRATPRPYLAMRLPSEIVFTLMHGEMQTQARGLSPEQMRSLATYLTGRPFDTEPDPAANLCRTPAKIATDDRQWAGWGHDPQNTRFQQRPGFGAADLKRLKVKWAFALPGLAGEPVVAGGTLFVSSRMGRVFALDTKTGCTHWSFDAGTPVRDPMAVAKLPNGTFIAAFGDQNAVVRALDAETGKVLWQTRVDDDDRARIVGAITAYDGRLYVPVASGLESVASDPAHSCCTFRGSVSALDAATGKVIWRGFTIPNEPKPFRVNSAGNPVYGPSGAGVWSAPTIDAKRGLVYATTGDAYTNPSTDATDALVAFDIKTGQRKWASQVLADDVWISHCNPNLADGKPIDNCPSPIGRDFDFSTPPMLHTLPNGKDVITAATKAEVLYGFDPDNRGNILWKRPLGVGSTMSAVWGVATDGKAIYAPTSGVTLDGPKKEGGLSAIDPATGTVEWRTEAPTPDCGWGTVGCRHAQPAAVTVIPGVVFSGGLDGHMRAYDAKTGKILWDMDTAQAYDAVNGVKAFGGNIDGAAETVADGTLFVNAGNATLTSPRHGSAVLAITVDGK